MNEQGLEQPTEELRARTMTEKAKLERVRELKYRQTAALSAITKCRNELVNSMTDEENLHIVKDNLDKLNKLLVSYQDIHLEYRESLTVESEIEKAIKVFEERQDSVLTFRGTVANWIKQADYALTENLETATQLSGHSNSSRPNSSRSRRSMQSSISRLNRTMRSSISARAREKVKIAELEIEKSLLKRKQEIELQKDQLRLESELVKARAKEKIFAEDQDVKTNTGTPNSFMKELDEMLQQPPPAGCDGVPVQSALNHEASPFIPRQEKIDSAEEKHQSHMITTDSLFAALSLPQPEVKKFSGDLTTFKSFMTAFDARVATYASSNADKLYFLDQHLEGEPKEIISGCFHLDQETGYFTARSLLDKEYGDPYKVSMVYLSKIHDWPNVKQDDCVGLKKLSLFLTNCFHAMKCLSDLNVLNHPQNLLSIVKKLPVYLQNKWREHVGKMRQTQQKLMQFRT